MSFAFLNRFMTAPRCLYRRWRPTSADTRFNTQKITAPSSSGAAIIPLTQIGSTLAFPLILIGLVLSMTGLAYVGVAFFSLSTLFQLVTLPVEYNASARALTTLDEYGTLDAEEGKQAKKVLSAAALTYVAALATSIVQLLRMISIVSNRKR